MKGVLVGKMATAGLALILILYGLYTLIGTVQPYVTFKEALQRKGTVRVAVFIDHSTRRYDPATGLLQFAARDTKGNRCSVSLSEVPPGGFEQSPMAVLVGEMKDGTFHARRAFIKCPSKYEGIPEHGQRKEDGRS